MLYKYIKWGCLTLAVLVLLLAGVLFKPGEKLPVLSAGGLGGLKHIELTNRGRFYFSLKASSAQERYPQISSFFSTSLITYYALNQVFFGCDLDGLGHVSFQSASGQLDLQMKHLRLRHAVLIHFDSGYSMQAEKVDVNLTTGQIKTVGLQMSVQGMFVPAASTQWQMN